MAWCDFTQNQSSGKIIKIQQSQALTSHFESFWSIVHVFVIHFMEVNITFLGYCHPSSTSKYTVESLCSTIDSDSALFFMFRTEDTNKALIQKDNTEACPFKSIEYAFSYRFVVAYYMSQCGNVGIFLPLWFYVKSILVDFISCLWNGGLEFWFLRIYGNYTLENVRNFQKCKFRAGKMVKMVILDFLKSAKIDFT